MLATGYLLRYTTILWASPVKVIPISPVTGSDIALLDDRKNIHRFLPLGLEIYL